MFLRLLKYLLTELNSSILEELCLLILGTFSQAQPDFGNASEPWKSLRDELSQKETVTDHNHDHLSKDGFFCGAPSKNETCKLFTNHIIFYYLLLHSILVIFCSNCLV